MMASVGSSMRGVGHRLDPYVALAVPDDSLHVCTSAVGCLPIPGDGRTHSRFARRRRGALRTRWTPATRRRRRNPGTDSRVEDWHGQSVDRDARLADELSEELPPDEAEQAFDEQATGRAEQAARHGDEIDPEQGESAYKPAQ